MRLLMEHGRSHGLAAALQNALLILAAALFQIRVQLFQIAGLWQRYPVVASEVATFALHSTLLVAPCRVAELTLKPPVRAEGNETAGLLAAIATQDLLHCTL